MNGSYVTPAAPGATVALTPYGDSSRPWWHEQNSHIGLDIMKPDDSKTLLKRSSLLDLLHRIQTGNFLAEDGRQAKVLAEPLGFPLDLLEQTITFGHSIYLRKVAMQEGAPEKLIAEVEPHPDLKYLAQN